MAEPSAAWRGRTGRADTLYLKCGGCGAGITIPDQTLLSETARQVAQHDAPVQEPYRPSGEVVCLTNVINRELERSGKPEGGRLPHSTVRCRPVRLLPRTNSKRKFRPPAKRGLGPRLAGRSLISPYPQRTRSQYFSNSEVKTWNRHSSGGYGSSRPPRMPPPLRASGTGNSGWPPTAG